MKVWYGYGTEHSMNLVMIGHFKSAKDARKTQRIIDKLTNGLADKIEIGSSQNRYDEDVSKLLQETNCYILSPFELEHFLYDIHTEVDDNRIVLTTDESEVSAFFKLMIENGAKVEIHLQQYKCKSKVEEFRIPD